MASTATTDGDGGAAEGVDKTALEALFKSLDLGSVTRVERISGGVVNGVYFVDSDAGGSYVLRLASKHMFGKEVSVGGVGWWRFVGELVTCTICAAR